MQRRRFLQLALAAPVTALATGCGGGWNLGFGPIRGGGNGGGTAPLLTVGRMAATVDHGSFTGALPAYGELQVATAFGSEKAAASGGVSIQAIQTETTLGFVTEASGAILYYGWLSSTPPANTSSSSIPTTRSRIPIISNWPCAPSPQTHRRSAWKAIISPRRR